MLEQAFDNKIPENLINLFQNLSKLSTKIFIIIQYTYVCKDFMLKLSINIKRYSFTYVKSTNNNFLPLLLFRIPNE